MKVALILPDGAADEPIPSLGGQTALEAARLPHMDAIARAGRVGTAVTAPAGFIPGSDVCTLSLLGYDPAAVYTGRAPLEAAAQHLQIAPDDVVVRCNLTTIRGGVMEDFSAGHIEQADAERLVTDLNDALGTSEVTFHVGVQYRHLMVLHASPDFEATCQAPHDIPGEPVADYLPRGRNADQLCALMRRAADLLARHPVNAARLARGARPATHIWLWGHGRMPQLQSFESRFGIRGAAITAVDLIRGIATLIGWPVLQVPGATGYLDTDYGAKGRAAVAALDDVDLIAVHVEAPDEAGHNGDAAAKVTALERIDGHIVGPVMDRLRREPAWRVLVMPDHPTPVGRRTHSATPPPFVMAGTAIAPDDATAFHETAARASGVVIDPGHDLMARLLAR